MSQEALQGFDLAPPLFLSRLHDTGLEPTHCPLAVVPTDIVPIERVMKGRTSSRLCIRMCWWSRFYRHLLFLLSRSPILLVMRIPDGSLPADLVGKFPYLPYYRAAFAFSVFLYPHLYRPPLRGAFPGGRETGLSCSASVP